jgi:DNA-binding NarL/FixJ family response regulator
MPWRSYAPGAARFLLKTTPPDQLAEGIQTVANKEKPVERSL